MYLEVTVRSNDGRALHQHRVEINQREVHSFGIQPIIADNEMLVSFKVESAAAKLRETVPGTLYGLPIVENPDLDSEDDEWLGDES